MSLDFESPPVKASVVVVMRSGEKHRITDTGKTSLMARHRILGRLASAAKWEDCDLHPGCRFRLDRIESYRDPYPADDPRP